MKTFWNFSEQLPHSIDAVRQESRVDPFDAPEPLHKLTMTCAHMKSRLLVIFTAGVALIPVNGQRITERHQRTGTATPLTACQSVPQNLSQDLRDLYVRICTNNIDVRFRTLIDFPHVHVSEKAPAQAREWEIEFIRRGKKIIQPSEMAAFLPLLAEIMATDDCIWERRGPFYIAEPAAGTMQLGGVDAVPFIIKALKSRKELEVYGGLRCASYIVPNLQFRGETNEVPAVCSNLLPYVAIHTTNAVPAGGWAGQPMGQMIPERAKTTQQMLERFLKGIAKPGRDY